MKTCSKCKIEKEDDDFNKNQYRCKDCEREYRENNKERIKKTNKKYRENNKERMKEINEKYLSDNKENIKIRRKKWREDNKDKKKKANDEYRKNNKEKIKNRQKQYYEENKERIKERSRRYRSDNKESIKKSRLNSKSKVNQHAKQRRLSDPFYKFCRLISNSIRAQIRKYNSSKNGTSSSDYINIQELYNHIESQFAPWMNWGNWGIYNSKTWDDNDSSTWTWQIDHIIPHSNFHYTSMDDEDFKKCWALENLRPLSSKQNLLEGNRRNVIDKGA
jgi:hypothetical protein